MITDKWYQIYPKGSSFYDGIDLQRSEDGIKFDEPFDYLSREFIEDLIMLYSHAYPERVNQPINSPRIKAVLQIC